MYVSGLTAVADTDRKQTVIICEAATSFTRTVWFVKAEVDLPEGAGAESQVGRCHGTIWEMR